MQFLIVPVGVSYYTFQSISYLVDIYRGNIKAEKHLGYYALYISYFPAITAGPICRAGEMIPQYKSERTFSYNDGVYSMKLMMWGFFKKTVVADNLAYRTGLIFNNLQENYGCALVFTAVFYSIQLYCDFSGYSDIAKGVSGLLGIRLPDNFNLPFLQTSLKKFWTHWHITLSTWLRDYIYIPLGGSRKGKFRKNLNTVITFLISGLWHGASWNFVIWGGIQGVAQVAEDYVKKPKCENIQRIKVFAIVSFGWIPFITTSLSNMVYFFSHLLDGILNFRLYVRNGILSMGFISTFDFAWHMFAYIVPLAVFDFASQKTDVIAWIATLKPLVRHSIYIILIIAICLLHSYQEVSFIYFNF